MYSYKKKVIKREKFFAFDPSNPFIFFLNEECKPQEFSSYEPASTLEFLKLRLVFLGSVYKYNLLRNKSV